MSMNSNSKVSEVLKDLAMPLSESEAFEIEKKILSARFLSEIQKQLEQISMKQKDFAKMMSVSPSYITQLFLGEKLVNIDFLAKAQKKLDMKFYVSTIDHGNFESMIETTFEKVLIDLIELEKNKTYNDPDGFWVFKKHSKPDYNKVDSTIFQEEENAA